MHFSCKILWCDGHFHESTRERTNVREGVLEIVILGVKARYNLFRKQSLMVLFNLKKPAIYRDRHSLFFGILSLT